MEWIIPVFDALADGVDPIVSALMALAGAYAVHYAGRLGAYAFLLRPLIDEAIRFAEEASKAVAKKALGAAQKYVLAQGDKLEIALDHIRRIVPNWLVSDETLTRWIMARLPKLGLGAAGQATVIIEKVTDAIEDVPAPKSAV